MPLVGVPWRGGRARGIVRLVRQRRDAQRRRGMGEIVALPARLRGSSGAALDSASAVVFGGTPRPAGLRPRCPAVAGIDLRALRNGDLAEVDGDRGTVRLPELREVEVVTVFLERGDGRILLLRRSRKVGSFRGRWAGVSGFLEGRSAKAQAFREVEEETGFRRTVLTVVREGAVVPARHGGSLYLVHPWRFRTRSVGVRLDWEHTAFAWVRPNELARRRTVPRLKSAWRAVARPSGRNPNSPRGERHRTGW